MWRNISLVIIGFILLLPVVWAPPGSPGIQSIELNDASKGDNTLDLKPAVRREINCSGTATHGQQLNAITSVTGEIYSANSSYGAVDNDENHYSNSSCYYNSNTGDFACSFSVTFYAEPTEWTCNVTVTDKWSQQARDGDTAIMNELYAVNISQGSSVSFGNMHVPQNKTGTPYNVTVRNEGNIPVDVEVDGWANNATAPEYDSSSAMNCTKGYIPIEYLRGSLLVGSYSDYTSFVETGYVAFSGFDLQPASGDAATPTERAIFLGLKLPAGNSVEGVCGGTVSVMAVTDT